MKNDPSLLNNILKIYIDPNRVIGDKDWQFIDFGSVDYKKKSKDFIKGTNKHLVISFSKKNRLNYFLFKFKSIFINSNNKLRYVLYVNDGLLSSFFNANNIKGYRLFTKKHLPKPKSILHNLIAIIPPSWRANVRFVILERHINNGSQPYKSELAFLEQYDFMMFSNPDGKLLLTKTETLKTGSGEVIKATANPDYLEVLKNEFLMLAYISDRIGIGMCSPNAVKKLENNDSFFIIEDYINGCSLRDILYDHAITNSNGKVCEIIERLDVWYNQFYSAFSGEVRKLSTLYSPIIETFITIYGEHLEAHGIVEKVSSTLRSIDTWHLGLVPVIAHNDLWPANFIVDADTMIAIDWERAKEGSAGIYDYFWMMISLAIVYIRDQKNLANYGISYQMFISNGDIISEYIHKKLKSFISKRGFDKSYYNDIMLLFLIEWSIQGFICLGRQTDMDKLAFKELVIFYNNSSENVCIRCEQ